MASLPPKTDATTKAPPAPVELLTPNEYAKAAKVSLSWLAKARRRGVGPKFQRFGRSVRYFPPQSPD